MDTKLNVSFEEENLEENNIKEALLMQIKQDETILEPIEYEEFKDTFCRVKTQEKTRKDYSYCIYCKILICTKNWNTSNLKRHISSDSHRKKLPTNKKNQLITSFLRPIQKQEKANTSKQNFGMAIAKMCAKDIEPFNIVNKEGFVEILQFAIDYGASHGAIDIQTIIPDESTIRQIYVKDVYNNTLMKVRSETLFIPFIGVSVDLWTDNINRSFLGVVTYFITENFDFKKITPGITLIEGTKSAEKVLEFTDTLLKMAFANLPKVKFYFTTDNGTNMVKAFSKNRVRCANHSLNLVLKQAMSSKNDSINIENIINFCHDLVKKFKNSSFNASLDHTLKIDVETRWNTHYIMIESILKSSVEIEDILVKNKEFKLADKLKQFLPQIEELKNFLGFFKFASDDLSKDTEPTLHMVIPYIVTFKKLCIVKSHDSLVIKSLKEEINALIDEKFEISIFHKTSTFLHPKYKKLIITNKSYYDDVLKFITDKINVLKNDDSFQVSINKNAKNSKKTTKLIDSLLFDDRTDIIEFNNNFDNDELTRYLDETQTDELLDFWKDKKLTYPYLSFIAREILSITASEVGVERLFSGCGLTMDDRRSHVSSELFRQMIFIKYNY